MWASRATKLPSVELGQRVDLGQGHVVVAEEAGELGEDRRRPVQLRAGDPGRGDRLLGLEVGDRHQVGDVAAADVVGVGLGDLLDVDAAHVAEQHQRPLRGPVPDDARVVLLLDLGFRVDEDAARHVAVDLELEDRLGVLGGLLGRVGELDAAGLHPPAAQHLRLDHDRPADLLGGRAGLLRGRAEAVLGDGDPRQLDDFPCLELVEAHQRRGTLSDGCLRRARLPEILRAPWKTSSPSLAAPSLRLALAIAGCGETVIDAAKTEDAIEHNLEKSAGMKIASVDCPSDVEVEDGHDLRVHVDLGRRQGGNGDPEDPQQDADVSLVDLSPNK